MFQSSALLSHELYITVTHLPFPTFTDSRTDVSEDFLVTNSADSYGSNHLSVSIEPLASQSIPALTSWGTGSRLWYLDSAISGSLEKIWKCLADLEKLEGPRVNAIRFLFLLVRLLNSITPRSLLLGPSHCKFLRTSVSKSS